MSRDPKEPVPPAADDPSDQHHLKFSKLPAKQLEPRRPRERKGQGTLWRWAPSPENRQTRTLEDRDA